MIQRKAFLIGIIFLYSAFLTMIASTLSVTEYEAKIYFNIDPSILYYPLHISTAWFGQNDIAIRLPMIVFHILSALLFFQISKVYLPKKRDQIWNMFVFILLPGVVLSSMLIHIAGLILFLLLLFIFLYQKDRRVTWILLPLYIFIDYSFFVLAFGLFLLHTNKKEYALALYSFINFIVAFYLGDVYIFQIPKNSISDTFLYLNLLISPVLFVYFLYIILFRIPTRGEKDILWAISLSALSFTFILSIRQKVAIEYFEPYVIIALPLLFRQFMHSFRVRIKQHRQHLNVLFIFMIGALFINSIAIFFSKNILLLVDSPRTNFIYKHYFISELAQVLKNKHIDALYTQDRVLQLRLKFYGIAEDKRVTLIEDGTCAKENKVTISYRNNYITHYCVTKENISQ